MAQSPVNNALVRVTPRGLATAHSAYTNNQGQAIISFSLTQTEYEKIFLLEATVDKDGYYTGESNLSTLPSYYEALRTGIIMNVSMIQQVSAPFNINPTNIVFTSNGGTVDITVSGTNGTWEIYQSDTRLQITRIDDITVRVVCPSLIIARTFDNLQIRWFNGSWQYRICSISQTADTSLASITFSGLVIDTDNNPVVDSEIQIRAETNVPYEIIAITSTTTNAQGQYSVTAQISREQWESFLNLQAWSFSDTHPWGAEFITTVPPYPSSGLGSIAFTDLILEAPSAEEILFRGRALRSDGTPIPQYIPIILQTSETISGDDYITFNIASPDSQGYYRSTKLFTPATWSKIKRIRAVIASPERYIEITNVPSFTDAIRSDIIFANIIV